MRARAERSGYSPHGMTFQQLEESEQKKGRAKVIHTIFHMVQGLYAVVDTQVFTLRF